MAEVNADKVIVNLSRKLGDALAREAVQEVYTDSLEQRVRELEGEVRGLVQKRDQETARQANGVPAHTP